MKTFNITLVFNLFLAVQQEQNLALSCDTFANILMRFYGSKNVGLLMTKIPALLILQNPLEILCQTAAVLLLN